MDASLTEAIQDIMRSATPDSSDRPANMILRGQGSKTVGIRLTDDMRNGTGPSNSELTTMKDVSLGERMQKSLSHPRPTYESRVNTTLICRTYLQCIS